MTGDDFAPRPGLRERAEALLAAYQASGLPPSSADPERLLHDLAVHQAELELQNEELQAAYQRVDGLLARYAELYHKAPIGFLTLDGNGAILQSNQTFLDLLGQDRADLQRTSLAELLESPGREVFLARYRAIFREPEGKTIDARLKRRDGSLLDIRITCRREDGLGAGAEGHLLAAVADITSDLRRLQLEAQVQRAQKMESLGILAGGVAHDMNNVLGAIQALAMVHQFTSLPDSNLNRDMGTIVRACERGGTLVKGLLGFARDGLAEVRAVDLNVLLREEAALLARTTMQKVGLVLDLEPALGPMQGDPSALSHAIMNLCVNAADAMPGGGVLTLATRNLESGWIELTVSDSGTGMTREVLDKAMDPFFTTKADGKGTGLGLPIVFGMVKAHQGRMEILSEPGQGTRIVLAFPGCAESPGEAAETLPAVPAQARHVLLVDDDELVQRALPQLLRTLGHQVSLAPSGEDALLQLQDGLAPDVVILDMNMPGLGGAGTMPRLRDLRPELPVLLATGRVDQAALDLVAAHPRLTLLSKPFSAQEVQRLLEML